MSAPESRTPGSRMDESAGQEVGRLETGVVVCGDDWPGLFVRGDDAARMVLALNEVLRAHHESEPATLELAYLRDQLANTDVRNVAHPKNPQRVVRPSNPGSPEGQKDAPEPGEVYGHVGCPRCGARLEIVAGDDEGLGALYDPDQQEAS